MSQKKQTCNPWVFLGSTVVILGVVGLVGAVAQPGEDFLEGLRLGMQEHVGWIYVLTLGLLGLFMAGIGISPLGSIRLGPDEAKPTIGNFGWYSMMISAGIGVGTYFEGVRESLRHFNDSPLTSIGTSDAAADAVGLTLFHWTVLPWACYALLGLSVAFFAFRKGLPFALRSAFYPIFGDRIYGTIGNIIDIFAIVSTMFGVVASLGYGAIAINAGLTNYGIASYGSGWQIAIIVVITLCATLSVVSGLDKGIKRLSELNILMSAAVFFFVLIVGAWMLSSEGIASVFAVLESTCDSVLSLGEHLIYRTFRTEMFGSMDAAEQQWMAEWTIPYWAWWIAWLPFVGIFIGRISKGRTIREFLFGTIVVPSIAAILWFGVMGHTALLQEVAGASEFSALLGVAESESQVLFAFLRTLPFAAIVIPFCLLSLTLFFVTSSDSASFVIDSIASGGHEDPPVWQRVYWAFMEGAVAIALLAFSGTAGLLTLRSMSLIAAFPVCLAIYPIAWGLVISLYKERYKKGL